MLTFFLKWIISLTLLYEYERALGVPDQNNREWSLITWDRSQKVKCFGTGPITLSIEQLR